MASSWLVPLFQVKAFMASPMLFLMVYNIIISALFFAGEAIGAMQ